MGFLKSLFGGNSEASGMTPPEPVMILESEGVAPISHPSVDQVRQAVLGLSRMRPSFVALTDEVGNYVQAAGDRPWCVLERRRVEPLLHQRAFQHTPIPKYKDGAKISTGAGEITMKFDEWFLLKDAAEVFVAFLHREAEPPQVQWRSLNEMFVS
jgi:hypothetical protein